MNRRVAWGVLAIGTFLLAGCGGDNLGDLKEYVARVKEEPPAPIQPLPDIKQIETFVYRAGNRRDPFVMLNQPTESATAKQTNGIAPDTTRRKEELEQYPLDSLHMVGSLEQHNVMWALLLTQDGELFRVHAGNYVGQNYGQITRVTDSGIELTEIVPDGSGGWQERQAAIALTKPE